jgi:hypothetical protein
MRKAFAALNHPCSQAINGTDQVRGDESLPMPTLFRFVVTLGILVALIYAAMFTLVMLVEPRKGEMTTPVPLEKLKPKAPDAP